MLERQIERKLVEEVKKRNGLCLKQNGMMGIPDRLVLLPGGHCGFVELKAPGKKPRALQLARIRMLKRMGFKVYVIDGMEQIDDVIGGIEA